jgi:hypothetical protein
VNDSSFSILCFASCCLYIFKVSVLTQHVVFGFIMIALNIPMSQSISSFSSSSSYMALQPISGLGLPFMRFRNLTLIDNW